MRALLSMTLRHQQLRATVFAGRLTSTFFTMCGMSTRLATSAATTLLMRIIVRRACESTNLI